VLRNRLYLCGILLLNAALSRADMLRIAGTDTMNGVLQAWADAYYRGTNEGTRIVLRTDTPLSAAGVDLLLAGEVDVAAMVREPFPSELRKIDSDKAKRALLVAVAGGSHSTKSSTHAIAVCVHESNPLAGITLIQLREIFREGGTIKRWGDLGVTGEWANRPIQLHGMLRQRASGDPPGIMNFLGGRALFGQPFSSSLREHEDAPGVPALDAIARAVAANPGAIGFCGFANLVPGTKSVPVALDEHSPFMRGTPGEVAAQEYPLARRIYLLALIDADKPVPTGLMHFVDFVLSEKAQRLVAADRANFLPLPAAMRDKQLRVVREQAISRYQPREVFVDGSAKYIANGFISVVGYNDMREMLTALNDAFAKHHPQIRFALSLPGTRAAPPALASGASAFAPMGAEFSTAELAAYRRNHNTDPLCVRIAHASLSPRALSGPVAVFVHRDNPLASLSMDELGAIFAGDSPRDLEPCGVEPTAALGLYFAERVLHGRKLAAKFAGFRQSRDVIAHVGSHPRAIGYAAPMQRTGYVKMLALAPTSGTAPVALTNETLSAAIYPLNRHLLIYVRQPVETWIREYLSFVLSREGQEIVGSGTLGYLPLNAAEAAEELRKLEAAAIR
jgi:phosphate transport system substrate-binding protein